MSSINMQIIREKLQPQFSLDQQGRRIPGRIIYPYRIESDDREYIDSLCNIVRKYALRGKLIKSEVPWIETYVSGNRRLRLIYKDNNYGANVYRIEASPDICDIPIHSIFRDSDYVTVFEYHDLGQELTIYLPGEWQKSIKEKETTNE